MGHLPADRAATVEAPRVLRALHRERHRTGGHGLPEPMDARIARRVGVEPWTGDHVGVQLVQPGDHGGVGRHRDEDANGPPHRRGERARRQRRVAARGDRERWPIGRPGPRCPTGGLGGDEVQQDREQVARLVAAGHVVGLVLHPHPAVGVEAEGIAERIGPLEGRGAEPGAGHHCDLGVEVADDRLAGRLGEAERCGVRVPGEVPAERHERVVVAVRPQRRHRLHELERVMAIVTDRVRAPPHQRLGDVDGGAADRAPPPGSQREIHRRGPAPVSPRRPGR